MPTALLSVYDKSSIVDFASKLQGWGWDLLSSGGTAKHLQEAGITVRDVAELVGGEAILGHKVVTLSREVHAGLLADRNKPEELAELDQLGIPFIDLAYVNLYPLKQELMNPDATIESITGMTDIGGPTMLRAAAKGRRLVIGTRQDAKQVLHYLEGHSGKPVVDDGFLDELAGKAEVLVTAYTLLSAIALAKEANRRVKLVHAYKALTGETLTIRAQI